MSETAARARIQLPRDLGTDQRGVVYAEFIMAFTPFFLAFLGIVQLALIGTAGLVVQTAAVKAVRAAAVILDDDPIFYREEPTGLLDFNGNSEDDGWVNSVGGVLTEEAGASWLNTCSRAEQQRTGRCCARVENGECIQERTNQLGELQSRGGPRLRAIRRAAYLPLSAIAPEWEQVGVWFPMFSFESREAPRYSLRRTGIGTGPALRLVTGFLVYNPIAAAINFPTAPHAETLRNAGDDFDGQVIYTDEEPVTVRVTYLYPCGVPIANLLVCNSILGMTGIEDTFDSIGRVTSDTSLEDLRTVVRDVQSAMRDQQDAYREFRRNLDELRAGAEYPDYQMALLLAQGARFHVLRREATLPIQGAPYDYPTQVQQQ